MRILVVEDEKDLLESIAEGLRIDGYAVDTCDNGEDAYELAFTENYDLIVLDLNLPKMDGIDVLKEIRKTNQDVKVLILTARTHIRDKVKGLDLGANDYLTKPFHFEELEARIRSLLRRKFAQVDTVLNCDKLRMDLVSRIAYADEKEISLTRKELGLLEYFLLNTNRVISQEELIEHVWDGSADSFSNVVRVHIASLRKKIKAALNYDPIQTRIGEGYILSERGKK
ncbi:response regulator transcription factor [Oceanirhabdus seepicola]|uniref:Stage 0 sporulation protein A homolog n=1 Tax=Oceanirhabdus seepicola TaxID=2828781 RepID=A0A9J6P6A7_9CLOT|nr:response regulator transcription factor [Oceanirhabdus seepicola]MCM1991325.1 response regulator transcription factor [Oceanirhabdus seepicola]